MERYKKKAVPYKSAFKEAFLKADIEKAIIKACKILQKRIGKKISISYLPTDVIKQDGRKLSGISAFFSNKQIRFNWHTKDISSSIVSVEYWPNIKLQPVLELPCEGMNILQIIDAIASMITNEKIGTFLLNEDASVEAKTGGALSKAIAQSITTWSTDMEIDEEKLARTRLSELYRSYEYWFIEVNKDFSLKKVPFPTFRNYLIQYMEKEKIKNIFMRSVTTVEAGKEKIIVTDEIAKRNFDAYLYKLSLEDQFAMVEHKIKSVIQGTDVAMMITGKAGMGKTKIVTDMLAKNKSGLTIKYMKGGVSSPKDLYNMLVKNNSSNTLMIFDDFDEPFRKQKAYGSLLKAMFDPKMRIVTWIGGDDNKKKPEEFLLKSRFIVITNIPKNKIDDAIYSRTQPIEISADVSSTIDYMEQNLDNIMPDYKMITKQMKQDVLDFMRSYEKDIKRLDFRLFQEILKYRAVEPESPLWKKWALMLLTKM